MSSLAEALDPFFLDLDLFLPDLIGSETELLSSSLVSSYLILPLLLNSSVRKGFETKGYCWELPRKSALLSSSEYSLL